MDATVYACSRSIYALKVLRVHCQPASSLHLVPGESTAAKVHYRDPVWQGLASSVDRARINKSVLDRMRAIGYTNLLNNHIPILTPPNHYTTGTESHSKYHLLKHSGCTWLPFCTGLPMCIFLSCNSFM